MSAHPARMGAELWRRSRAGRRITSSVDDRGPVVGECVAGEYRSRLVLRQRTGLRICGLGTLEARRGGIGEAATGRATARSDGGCI
jgi:hypothetical protein